MKTEAAIACLVSAAAVMACASLPLSAQNASAVAQTGPDVPAEIVVTATKHSEAVSKVPISIVAQSQEQLDTQGIKTLADLAATVPGLLFTEQNVNGAPAANFTIRGIESRTSAPTTSVYLDDIPLLTIAENFDLGVASATPQVFDLDRVEILRGPQGTLFGNSAEGGAVRFISPAPSMYDYHAYGRGELSYTPSGAPSNSFGMAVSGPIAAGVLGFRASASSTTEGGYIDRVAPVLNGPGNGGLQEANANWNRTNTGRFALLAKPTDWLTIQPSFYIQQTYQNDSSRYEVSISDRHGGHLNNAANAPLPATDLFSVAELKMEADLGSSTLTSISGYDRRNFALDGDFLPYQDFQLLGSPYAQFPGETGVGYYHVAQHSLTQELRLASNTSRTRLTWVIGAYYNDLHQHDNGATVHDDVRPVIGFLAAMGFIPGQYFLDKYDYYGDVVLDVENTALFGNADYNLTDTLKLGVGLRGSVTNTKTVNDVEGAFTGHQFNSGRVRETAVTPKFTLSWQPNERDLFYTSAGKGYRNGGVNTITTTAAPGCVAFQQENGLVVKPSYEPDSLWSYEIGAKSSFSAGRVRTSASAYHIDWSNIQTSAQLGPCSFAAIFNLGGASVNGFDADVRAQATQRLNLGISIGYTKGTYKQTVGGVVSKGDQIGGPGFAGDPATPPVVLTLDARYDVPISGDRTLYAWLQDVYRSRNPGPFAALEAANFISYNPGVVGDPAYNVFNTRLGMSVGGFDISVFASNLLNAQPQLSLADSQAGDPRFYAYTLRPRTVGVNVTYRH